MNFLDFIKNKKVLSNVDTIAEAFKKESTKDAFLLIYEYLSKHVKGTILVNSNILNKATIDDKPYICVTYYHIIDSLCDVAFTLNWKANNTSIGLDSISFAFGIQAQKMLWHEDSLIKTSTIIVTGKSIAYILPYIIKVI